MEQLLLKMARQLDSLDEASLLSLWEKYAATVSRFEPTRRWEEAALVFSLIQAKHWKNQLFNLNWAAQSHPGSDENGSEIGPDSQGFAMEAFDRMPSISFEREFTPFFEDDTPKAPEKHAKVIAFRPLRREMPPVIEDLPDGNADKSDSTDTPDPLS